jgi:hypothetical protein
MGRLFSAEIANDAGVSTDALNYVGIIESQKLDAAVVDGQPYLDLYKLARSFIRAEPLVI